MVARVQRLDRGEEEPLEGGRHPLAVEDLVQRQVRKEDVLARYGGEEFAIILPHTDRLGAAILAERVREAVAANECVRGELSVTVTISLGVVSMPMDEVTTVEHFVELTDRRMYQAKKEGRNQTVFE